MYARSKKIGQTPADPNKIQVMAIMGNAIALGDASDFNNGRQAVGNEIVVGIGNPSDGIGASNHNDFHMHPIIYIPMINVIPAFSRVLRAMLYLKTANGNKMPADTVINGGHALMNFYGVRRAVSLTQADFQVFKTGSNWTVYGAQPTTDLTASRVGQLDFTQNDYNAANALPNGQDRYMDNPFDIKGEVQYCSDRAIDCYLLGQPDATWGGAGGTTAAKDIRIKQAVAGGLALHYLDILYVPPICLHGSLLTAGRPIDIGNVLDITSNDSKQQVYLGFIDQGETGDSVKYYVRNTRTDRVARRMVLEGVRSFASKPVSHLNSDPTLPSLKILRSVDCYNLHQTAGVTDELTPKGRWKIQATSSTQFSVFFASDFVTYGAAVATGLLFSADNTITVSSVKQIKIRAVKWGSGAAVSGDYWTFDTVSDTTDPSFPVDSYDMMSLVPATVGSTDVANTALKRRLRAAPTQQLRASTYTYNDGGTNRTVVPLIDTQLANYQVGDRCVIFSGTDFEEVQVHQVYLTGDALPAGGPAGDLATGDAVMLETTTAHSYDATAFLTSGLYVNQLDKAEDVTVDAAGAAAGQATIPISAAVSWADGTSFIVLSLATGQTQSLVKQSGGGSSIVASANLNFALAAGDFLIRDVATNYAAFFAQGAVPLGATLGDRLGYLRVYEARSQTLQNVV